MDRRTGGRADRQIDVRTNAETVRQRETARQRDNRQADGQAGRKADT